MLEGINILVAEDNLLNQKIANFILQKQHASVTAVLNGREAIELLQERKFDIVLMDLQMPEMDGYMAARYIRKDMNIDMPIIAVTASISDEELNQSIADGMNAYISKPFDPDTLCTTILSLVKENKLHQTI